MAVHQKLSEIGWFYHAPDVSHNTGPMGVPLTSQIPGLNDVSMMEPEPQRPQVIRDTDTKYIRLAKMGGRGDLLRHKEVVDTRSQEPKAYPRVGWYYLEDNALEDARSKGESQWSFGLPEYMVHDEFRPNGDSEPFKHNRLPYAYDSKSAYDRDERSKAIPEFQQFGYGVRQKKLRFAKEKAEARKGAPRMDANGEHRLERAATLPPLYNRVEKPQMSKIMSYGYENEWAKVRDDWYSKTKHIENRFEAANDRRAKSHPGPGGAEPKAVPGKPIKYHDFMGARAKARQDALASAGKDTQKTPFKLSKFNKVDAKVTSHR